MRDDLTNNLVHLTKGIGDDSSKHREEALLTFDTIVSERRLLGNTGFIKGGYRCVCFSEAPIGKLSYLIASGADEKFKYQPYGIMVSKKWLFEKGGRPVIYGPANEFDELPERFRYRHVRMHLGEYTIDHSWEREWRLRTNVLEFASEEVTLVVPDRQAKDAIQSQEKEENWHFIVLSDLGIDISAI